MLFLCGRHHLISVRVSLKGILSSQHGTRHKDTGQNHIHEVVMVHNLVTEDAESKNSPQPGKRYDHIVIREATVL